MCYQHEAERSVNRKFRTTAELFFANKSFNETLEVDFKRNIVFK